MTADHNCSYREVYGRLTAFITRLYENTAQSEASIARQLRHCESSRSEIAQARVPELKQLLGEHTAITCVLELLLQKGVKEEHLARLPDELRDLFEAEYGPKENS